MEGDGEWRWRGMGEEMEWGGEQRAGEGWRVKMERDGEW